MSSNPSALRKDAYSSEHDNALSDERRLAQLGHKESLRRSFSLYTLGALCVCLMATWEALSTVIATALASGGPPCLFYNYILSFLFSVCIAASLAEIASIYPTAGGQYHWVAALSPPSSRAVAAYMTGWISVGGQIVFTASAAFSAALMTNALVVLDNDSYIPQRYQGMLFYWAALVIAGVVNIYGMGAMPRVNLVSGVIHVAGLVAIIVTLGVLADKSSSAFVFTEFSNNSGWGSDGVSWLVGLISAVYPFLGYDAASHLAEEIPQASRNVPIAMVGSVCVNGIMAFAYCIVLLYSSGSTDFSKAPLGFPFIQIYLDATNSRAGTIVMSLIPILIAIAATIAGTISTSRTLWAFARDKATPFHGYLGHVHPHRQIPVRAVVVVVILQALLGLIYLGNDTAFNAVLSMAAIALYLSYILPIIYMLAFGRRNLKKSDYGPFRLGKSLGTVLNILGCIWMIVVIVFSAFPTVMPLTPQNMNYSSVVLGGWLVFGVLYYTFWGRRKFVPPMSTDNTLAEEDVFYDGITKEE